MCEDCLVLRQENDNLKDLLNIARDVLEIGTKTVTDLQKRNEDLVKAAKVLIEDRDFWKKKAFGG